MTSIAARVMEQMVGEVVNSGPGGEIMEQLQGLEKSLTDKIAGIEAKSGEAINSSKSFGEELEGIKKTLTDTQAAIATLQEVQNSAPASEADAVLQALHKLYNGESLEEVINSAPAGFLREEKIKKMIEWSGKGGFDLMKLAFIKQTKDNSTNIALPARPGLRRSKADAREWTANAVPVTLQEIRDYVSVSLSDRKGSDYNIVRDITASYFDNRQLTLEAEFVLGQDASRGEDAPKECKGILTYETTTTNEAGKLRVKMAGTAGAMDDEQIRDALTAAYNAIPQGLRSRAVIICNTANAATLRKMKDTTGEKLTKDGKFDGLCSIKENGHMPAIAAGKIPFVVMVTGRAYALAVNPEINAGVDKSQGDEAYWTMQMITGKIADFEAIYGVKVNA